MSDDNNTIDNKEDGFGLSGVLRKAADSAFRTTSIMNPILALAAATGYELATNTEKRERVLTGVLDGVRDLFRDVPWAIVWVFDKGGEVLGYDMNTGDRGYSDETAQNIEDFLDKYMKQPVGLGQAEFRMAAGWKLPRDPKTDQPTMLYNGQTNPVYTSGEEKGKPISEIRSITAIFYKHPDGKIEVLDSDDSRWGQITGPYGGVQLLQMVGTMGAGAALKGAISLPRAVTFGETATKVLQAGGKIARAVPGAAGVVEGVSSVGVITNEMILDPFYFKPNAMSKLARMFAHPETLNADTARKAINTMNSQYSHLTGPMTEQIYIKSLSNDQSPWRSMDEISFGNSIGIQRDNPFDDIRERAGNPHSYAQLPNTNIKNLIKDNPVFMGTYYGLVERALNGGLDKNAKDGLRLSDQEMFSLKFMMNINSLGGFHMDLTRGPVIANEAERRHVRDEIRDNLEMQIANEIITGKSKLEDSAEAIEAMMDDMNPPTPQEIRAYTSAQGTKWNAVLAEQNANDEAEALRLGQTMAMGMVP